MKIVTVDHKKCVGCRNCEMACAFEQSKKSCEAAYSNIRVNDYIDDRFVIPNTCLHCEDAWCLNVCPANAIYRDIDTNAVVINQNRCAGCKMCIMSCPYANIHFDNERHVSQKCDLCDGKPRCVTHCIGGCLNYEEIDDLAAKKEKHWMH